MFGNKKTIRLFTNHKAVFMREKMLLNILCQLLWSSDVISYPLFADVDTGIYHMQLSVDKFPYPHQQTRGNKFIPCSSNICHILKCFCSFKIPTIPSIWPKSPYKHSVTRSYCRVRKADDGRNRNCDVINDVPLSLYLTLMTSNVRYVSIFHSC